MPMAGTQPFGKRPRRLLIHGFLDGFPAGVAHFLRRGRLYPAADGKDGDANAALPFLLAASARRRQMVEQ